MLYEVEKLPKRQKGARITFLLDVTETYALRVAWAKRVRQLGWEKYLPYGDPSEMMANKNGPVDVIVLMSKSVCTCCMITSKCFLARSMPSSRTEIWDLERLSKAWRNVSEESELV